MNYIRGAVNAISAPYHYYKDLPPINPSTLTGAIDVIVIQRPTDNGDTELVCSPFHVRFGKWQVLRPSEKKVNVYVNGHPIPFNMKIGDAGEAFFVFETDGDVPDDLITSPILQPTRPDEPKVGADGRGMKGADLEPKLQPDDQDTTRVKNEESVPKESPEDQEPDFLDLDAQPSKPVQVDGETVFNLTPNQAVVQLTNEQSQSRREVPGLPSPPLTPTRRPSNLTPEMAEQDQRVDAALKSFRDHIEVSPVDFNGNVAFDAEGYHSHHAREKSDCTISSLESKESAFPLRGKPSSPTPSSVHGLELNNLGLPNPIPSSITFPMLRAASEPPPDIEEHHDAISSSKNQASSSKMNVPLSPVQEYSWEWGAFPQPSPVNAFAGRMDGALGRSRAKGKGKANNLHKPGIPGSDDEDEEDGAGVDHQYDHGRSKSVPPELEGSPQRRLKELVEGYDASNDPEDDDVDEASFGKGGILRPSKRDPSRFALQIEGRRIIFELSIVCASEGQSEGALSDPEEDTGSGWRSRHGRANSFVIFDGRDEVEAARLFALGKVDYKTFLDSDKIIKNPWLVIRWAGNQYITRNDGSPLMNALVVWRNATLQQRVIQPTLRPTSPVSDEEINDIRPVSPPLLSDDQQPEDKYHHRSRSEPPEEAQGKPMSSSWVRWWSRSKKTVAPSQQQLEKVPPVKNEPLSSPASTANKTTAPDQDVKRSSREIPPADSAPAYPSTPVQAPPAKTPAPTAISAPPPASRKFAKSLRLSSDQLKSLNLKPGANTITFSLSASGVVACTARIFVWDSTDLVVVSDIDGTITKSDGLGHVFAMIGRDWTHLGVAKLYTDITRNGYKIMYLTSRAIGQADATRAYLEGIKQNNYQLPEGPVIMSPDRLITSLHREVILRKPELFKMACLRDIQRLFGEASRNPFYAGFGNRITDALSYRSVNVPSARIFTIDSTGEVKMELLELAGYKSSYIHMTDLVDQMFPPIHRKWTPEFTDFNYWKTPVHDFPLPDLSPPSPALSARSDTSTLARLRNFSLVSGRQGSMTPASRASPPPDEDRGRSSHLRQMSSFERLSSTLGWSQTKNDGRRDTSPASSYDSDDEGGNEGEGGRKRERRRSMTSMPGTLDEMHFGIDDDDDDDQFYGGDDESADDDAGHMVHEPEEVGEEDFDEDLLVAGEMKNVPFL
ncbi:hypothetical protein H2248_006651 [Termitomyces sp. 'cryptogamus']|nr:hypothetical protein H2248_006651 [Termitomyces sp. 'cryptogamus']